MIGELIMALFHARTNAHVLHLKSLHLGEHKALNEFYDEVVDLADELAEAYQGDYGLIKDFPPAFQPETDPLEMLDNLRNCVDRCAEEQFGKDDSHLNNICDEIRTLIARTAYMLRFQK